MKVVRRAESFVNAICQNPMFASNFVKIFAPPSWARICLTDGRICLSRQTFWFSFVRSAQIRSRPLPFGTSTIPAHQSVGPSTLEVTSRSSIHCSSFLTLSRSGRATLLGVVRENAMAPSFRVTLYVPSIQPTPWKRWGNFWTIASFCVRTGSTCPTRLRDSMAGLLSSGLCRPCTTYALVSEPPCILASYFWSVSARSTEYPVWGC